MIQRNANSEAVSDADSKETGRIEAFSDGVFAIAITLLVLDLRLPAGLKAESDEQLYAQLWVLWPKYVAFMISFAFTGIMWINHHRLFSLIKRSDTVLLILNLLLLFGVTVLQFPTGVLADQMGEHGERAAALVYGGVFVVVAFVFNGLWRYAAHDNRLLDRNADPVAVRKISQQYAFGPLMYVAAFFVAFVSVPIFLVVQVLLAIFFALPGPPLVRTTNKNEVG